MLADIIIFIKEHGDQTLETAIATAVDGIETYIFGLQKGPPQLTSH